MRWRVDGIKRVKSWLSSGAMELLWRTYRLQCDSGECGPPRKKRKGVYYDDRRPEQIIAEYIPALKAFLVKQKVWD